MIPRIIHKIWFKIGDGPSSPPAKFDEMRQSWCDLHPGWTIMEWDKDRARSFLREHYPTYLPMFDSYKREIYRIDAIRYFLLHHYGGFYADTDTIALTSIEPLRKHRVVLCGNRYTKNFIPINNNHFMGAVPRTEFFKLCIERLPTARIFQTTKESYVGTLAVAGPFFLTSMVGQYKRKGDLTIFDHDTEHSYFNHVETHSWKLSKSITNDLIHAGLVTTGVVLAGVWLKNTFDHKNNQGYTK